LLNRANTASSIQREIVTEDHRQLRSGKSQEMCAEVLAGIKSQMLGNWKQKTANSPTMYPRTRGILIVAT